MKTRALLPIAAMFAALTIHPMQGRADDDEAAELSEQPAAVQKTAHEIIGQLKIEEVEPSFEGGQHATEVEYTDNGKKMAIVIAKDGTLIQKEYRMSSSQAPQAIEKAVSAKYPDGRITHIKEVERKDSKFFELSVKAGGKSHQLKLDQDGKPLPTN